MPNKNRGRLGGRVPLETLQARGALAEMRAALCLPHTLLDANVCRRIDRRDLARVAGPRMAELLEQMPRRVTDPVRDLVRARAVYATARHDVVTFALVLESGANGTKVHKC